MHITASRVELERALSLVSRAASTKNTIPILAGIHLEANEGLTLRATDMAQSAKTNINCEVKAKGSLVIPAKNLVELVRKVEGETVELLVNAKGATELRCGKSKHILLSFPGDQFPAEMDTRSATVVTVSQSSLRHLIDRTAFAADVNSTDEVKVTCVRLELAGDKLIASASDRVIIAQTYIPVTADDAFTIMVPATALKELAKLLRDGDATMYVNGRAMVVEANKYVFGSLLIAGDPLPNFDRFLPARHVTTITTNRSELAGAVDRAASVHTSVQFTTDKCRLLLESQSDSGATATEEVDCMVEGDFQSLLLHGDKVLKILHALEAPTVTIQFAGGRGTTVWTDGDTGYYLTNPLLYR